MTGGAGRGGSTSRRPPRGPGPRAGRRPGLAAAWALLAAPFLAASFPGAPLAAQENAQCLECHGAGVDGLASFVDPGRYGQSAHARLDCSACHADLAGVEEYPHATGLAPVECTDCHDDDDGPITAWRQSVHGEAEVGCAVCHAPHEIGAPGESARASCARCHAGAREQWARGVHGAAAPGAAAPADCVDCHAGHAVHAVEPARLREACARCHAAAVEPWRASVHGGDPGNGHAAAGCEDCHGGHDLRAARDPLSRVNALRLPDTCESCHHPEPSREHPAPGGERVSQYETSVHGQGLREHGLVVTATCVSCHGAHDVRPPASEGAPTARLQLPFTCGKCHAGILYEYLDGVHGSAFEAGSEDVPVCNDCHSEHAVKDPALAGTSVSKALVAETCARCHADDELARRYGLESSVRRSWGNSYHGIAGAFGESAAASCASCHGAHDVLPASDPRSPVHADNLDQTCGACHPGASAAFARVPVHSVIERAENPVPWFVRRIYAWLVGALIGAFVLFILIDLFGRLRRRLGWGPPQHELIEPQAWPDEDELIAPGESFRRMGRHARLQHAVLIVSFSLLVLTGLPVFLHDVAWMRALIDIEGGFALRSRLHRLAALVLIGLSLWHVVALAISPAARRWLAQMMLRPRDVGDFVQELGHALGCLGWVARSPRLAPLVRRCPWLCFDRRPRLGRYGLVEKLEYGAVLWGNIVMIATGVILWRPGWFLDRTPAWTFDVCRVVHGFEATLAFLAIIVWHMYHVHLRPGVFPMSRTWLDGRISRHELREHHPGEYLELLERRRAARQGGGGTQA